MHVNETLKHFLYVHSLSISFDYAHFELGLRNFDRSMRICYRHDIGSVQLILREARTAFQGTDSPKLVYSLIVMINWPYLSTFRVTHTPNFDSSETPEKINVQDVFAIEQFVAWILLIQKLKVKFNEEVRCQVWLMIYHIGLYRVTVCLLFSISKGWNFDCATCGIVHE